MAWKSMVGAVVLAGVVFGSAYAAEGTHESREAMMKKIAGAVGQLGAIAKGNKPYDAATVKTSLSTIAETAKAFPSQFGPSSDKKDPEVNPKLWDNMEDFTARANALSDDAQMALASLPADPAAVGASLKKIGANCGACHQAYRLSK